MNDIEKDEKPLHLEMFQMYMNGSTLKQIGDKYGISKQAVCKHASRYKWKEKKNKVYDSLYKNSLPKMRKLTAMGIDILDGWLTSKLEQGKIRELTLDEVSEVRQVLSKMQDQVRLEDGKPTVSTSGTVEHVLRLPPGVKTFGVIPPTNKVKTIEVLPEATIEEQDDEDYLES